MLGPTPFVRIALNGKRLNVDIVFGEVVGSHICPVVNHFNLRHPSRILIILRANGTTS